MFEKVVKVGPNHKSYFYDSKNDKMLYGYSPSNKNCKLRFDEELFADAKKYYMNDEVKIDRSGDLYINIGGKKVIIDDGWRSELIRSGYIVYKDYDQNMIIDSQEGFKVKNLIRSSIVTAVAKAKLNAEEIAPFRFKFSVVKDEFEYIFYIDSLSAIVNKNQSRKLNNLPFYPFIRNMDKYGCVYLSVFAKRKSWSKSDPSVSYADSIIAQLIGILGDEYKFAPNNIGTRILEFQEMK